MALRRGSWFSLEAVCTCVCAVQGGCPFAVQAAKPCCMSHTLLAWVHRRRGGGCWQDKERPPELEKARPIPGSIDFACPAVEFSTLRSFIVAQNTFPPRGKTPTPREQMAVL